MSADLDWIMAIADEIGRRIETGELPPQDDNGRYLLDEAAADVVRTVTS